MHAFRVASPKIYSIVERCKVENGMPYIYILESGENARQRKYHFIDELFVIGDCTFTSFAYWSS